MLSTLSFILIFVALLALLFLILQRPIDNLSPAMMRANAIAEWINADGPRMRPLHGLPRKAQIPANQRNRIELDLERAGLNWTRAKYQQIRIACAFAVGLGSYLFGQSYMISLAATIASLALVPYLYVRHLQQKRLDSIERALPEAIDIIVRGSKAGNTIQSCIEIITREMSGPVREEFLQVRDRIQVGQKLSTALMPLFDRVPTAEISFLISAITINEDTGGRLADTLASLSDILRARVDMKRRIKALSAEGRYSALIIGSLVPGVYGFMLATNGDYLAPLHKTLLGNLVLGGIGFIMLVGILLMRRIINIRV